MAPILSFEQLQAAGFSEEEILRDAGFSPEELSGNVAQTPTPITPSPGAIPGFPEISNQAQELPSHRPLLRTSPIGDFARSAVAGAGNVITGAGNLAAGVAEYAKHGPALGLAKAGYDLGNYVYDNPEKSIDFVGKTAAETAGGAAALGVFGPAGPYVAPAASAAAGVMYEEFRDAVLGRQPILTGRDIAEKAAEYSGIALLLGPINARIANKLKEKVYNPSSSWVKEKARQLGVTIKGPQDEAILAAQAARDDGFILEFGGRKSSTNQTKGFLNEVLEENPEIFNLLELDDIPTKFPTIDEISRLPKESQAAALANYWNTNPIQMIQDRVADKLNKIGQDKALAMADIDVAIGDDLLTARDFNFRHLSKIRDESRLTPEGMATFNRLALESKATMQKLGLNAPNKQKLVQELVKIDDAIRTKSYIDRNISADTRLNVASEKALDNLNARRKYIVERLNSSRTGATAGEVWEEISRIDDRLLELGKYDVGPGSGVTLNPSKALDDKSAEVAALTELRAILKDGLHSRAGEVYIGSRLAVDVLEDANKGYSALKEFDKLLQETKDETRQQINKIIQGNKQEANVSEVSGPLSEVNRGVMDMIFKDRSKRIALASALDRDVNTVRRAAEILKRKKAGLPAGATSISEKAMEQALPLPNNLKAIYNDDRSRFTLGWILYHSGNVDSPFSVFDADEKSVGDYADMLSAQMPDLFVGKAYASEGVDGRLKPSAPTFAADLAASEKAINGIDSVKDRFKRKYKLYSGYKPYGGRSVELPDVNIVEPTSPSTDYLKPEPVAEEKSAVDRVRENLEE